MMKEFKDFAMRGNVMDMAVGIIIGGAFTPIVKSLVDDILMPVIGKLTGGVDFGKLVLTLVEPIKDAEGKITDPGVVLGYGKFINATFTFIIVAFAVFMLIKAMNAVKQKEAPAPAAAPTTKDCGSCCMPIPVKASKCGHCTSAA
ncbi:MAG: large-conductance mechanosensitive channel protein MscL [Planctomycetota bacterium]|nr:large-conductance mechanosensitive channel protein MscL [Planctomycetota bacterium]